VVQLELWPRQALSAAELAATVGEIRNLYWVIRNTRRDLHGARRRQIYRKIEVHKKRLLVAGVSRRAILDLLACCRSRRCIGKRCLDCRECTAELAPPI
jgi:hypothetical protein